MQIILSKAVFNDAQIKNYMLKLTVSELNNLSTPCYYPDWKKHFHELLHLSNLNEKDLKDFGKRFFSESKAKKRMESFGKDIMIQQDIGINLLLILMYHFLEKKDSQTYLSLMIYHLIHQYGNRIRVYLKFCKEDVFEYTLNQLNPSHLFSREKTISNAIVHLSKEMQRKYTSSILELDPDKITLFFYESRSRIAQSLRSFAELYYQFEKKGYGLGSHIEDEKGTEIYSQELDKIKRISEFIATKITVYKELNYNVLNQSKSLTKVNMSNATLIINTLQNPKFLNDLTYLIELFFKDLKSINQICGRDSISYIRKLMGVKRSSKEVYFKKEVSVLLLKVLENVPLLKQKYLKSTIQTKYQMNLFFAYYIILYSKSIVC